MLHIFIPYILIICLNTLSSPGLQDIEYECDPKFRFMEKSWTDPQVTAIYDSLNKINFSEVNLELRIWQNSYGQIGLVKDVFILRHYREDSSWKGFYYVGMHGREHRSLKEFFTNNELRVYSEKDWRLVWDSLIAQNVLEIEPPSQEDLHEEYDFYVNISHDTFFTIELIKEHCRRRYAFSYGIINLGNFEDIPEFLELQKIVKLRQEVLKENGAYDQ